MPKQQRKLETELMRKFCKINVFVGANGNEVSTYGIFAMIDFNKMPEDQIISLFFSLRERMEQLIDIYDRFTNDEKMHLQFFDEDEWLMAKAKYNGIKEAMDES